MGRSTSRAPTSDGQNGTADLPVVITALHERQAIIHSNGLESAISLSGCSHWILQGLTATIDNTPPGDSGVPAPSTVYIGTGNGGIVRSDDVVLRRMLVDGNNQAFPGRTPYSSTTTATTSSRRASSSRKYTISTALVGAVRIRCTEADGGGTRLHQPSLRGGSPVGIQCYACDATVENSVVETAATAFLANGGYPSNFKLLGSIAIGSSAKLFLDRPGVLVVQDFAAIAVSDASTSAGLTVNYSTASASISNVSLFYAGGAVLGPSAGGGTVANLDSVGGIAKPGIDVIQIPDGAPWNIESSNVYPNFIVPADACASSQCIHNNPGIDQPQACLAYVGPGSTMFDAGAGGGPLGANSTGLRRRRFDGRGALGLRWLSVRGARRGDQRPGRRHVSHPEHSAPLRRGGLSPALGTVVNLDSVERESSHAGIAAAAGLERAAFLACPGVELRLRMATRCGLAQGARTDRRARVRAARGRGEHDAREVARVAGARLVGDESSGVSSATLIVSEWACRCSPLW